MHPGTPHRQRGRWHWLLGLLWLLGNIAPAVAQRPDLVAVPAPAPTRADTAAALHQLFGQQRQGQKTRLLLGGVSLVLYNYFLSFSPNETTKERIGTSLLAGFVGFQVYNVAAITARLRRYRPAHEQRLLAAWQQGRPLPRWCRRQLPRYLHPAVPPAAPPR